MKRVLTCYLVFMLFQLSVPLKVNETDPDHGKLLAVIPLDVSANIKYDDDGKPIDIKKTFEDGCKDPILAYLKQNFKQISANFSPREKKIMWESLQQEEKENKAKQEKEAQGKSEKEDLQSQRDPEKQKEMKNRQKPAKMRLNIRLMPRGTQEQAQGKNDTPQEKQGKSEDGKRTDMKQTSKKFKVDFSVMPSREFKKFKNHMKPGQYVKMLNEIENAEKNKNTEHTQESIERMKKQYDELKQEEDIFSKRYEAENQDRNYSNLGNNKKVENNWKENIVSNNLYRINIKRPHDGSPNNPNAMRFKVPGWYNLTAGTAGIFDNKNCGLVSKLLGWAEKKKNATLVKTRTNPKLAFTKSKDKKKEPKLSLKKGGLWKYLKE